MPISNQKIAVYLEIKNTKENRLGIPLPTLTPEPPPIREEESVAALPIPSTMAMT